MTDAEYEVKQLKLQMVAKDKQILELTEYKNNTSQATYLKLREENAKLQARLE